MGKLTIELDANVEKILRDYIKKRYFKSHGKLKKVLEIAIREYCGRHDEWNSPFHFVDTLGKGKHVALFYEYDEYARMLQSRYLLNGLTKGERSVYFLPKWKQHEVETIKQQLTECGLDADSYVRKGLFQISTLPKSLKDPQKMMNQIMARYGPGCNIVMHPASELKTEEQLNAHMTFENGLHKIFGNLSCTILCNYYIGASDPKKHSKWMQSMLQSHNAAIFAPSGKGIAFDLDELLN